MKTENHRKNDEKWWSKLIVYCVCEPGLRHASEHTGRWTPEPGSEAASDVIVLIDKYHMCDVPYMRVVTHT